MNELKEYINEQIKEILWFIAKAKNIDDVHRSYYNGQLLAYNDVLEKIGVMKNE